MSNLKEYPKSQEQKRKILQQYLDSDTSGDTPYITTDVLSEMGETAEYTGGGSGGNVTSSFPMVGGQVLDMGQVHMTPFKHLTTIASSAVATGTAVVNPKDIGQVQVVPFGYPTAAAPMPMFPHTILPEPFYKPMNTKQHAYTFLESAVKEMKDRALQRDKKPGEVGAGERSMAATVKAFNALTGKTLTEEEGWEFMILLKLVRGRQGDFRADDYTDAAAYSGLLGECASIRPKK